MAERAVIVLARALPPSITQHLEQLAEVRRFDPEAAEASLAGAQVWLGAAVDPVDEDLIARFPDSLRLVANLGVGTDNIDFAAAAARNLQVCNTPVVTEDTADLTMALLLATARRLGECERHLRKNDWDAGAALLGRRVHGATVGIVGLGAIGQAVARRASGFGVELLYHGPNRKIEAEAETGASFRPELEGLLRDSDYVVLTCPLTEDTRHLINSDTLRHCRSDAILINTGRGPLIDEEALVDALEQGRLGGAGLDVFEFEPRVSPALMQLPNVVLLPHIGSATGDCRRDMVARAIANIASFLKTGDVLDPVRPRG